MILVQCVEPRPGRRAAVTVRAASMVLMAIVAAAGCSSGKSAAGSAPSTSAEPARASGPRRSQNVITSDELATIANGNLYDAVSKLRPNMVRQRAAGGSSGAMPSGLSAMTNDRPNIYIDDQLFGTIDRLRELTTAGVIRVQFYSPSEAQARFGNGNLGGVIQVVMRK